MSLASFRSLAVASIPAIVVLSLAPFAGASSLYNQAEFTPKATSDVLGAVSLGVSNLLSETEFANFSSPVERTTTSSEFELPPVIALATFSTFGRPQGGPNYGETPEFAPAVISYLGGVGGAVGGTKGGSGQGERNDVLVSSSFTSAIATAPEPEGAGIAVVALLLVIGAFGRRLRRGSEATLPLAE
jgi:MYXO-CTERM domain-containing protein